MDIKAFYQEKRPFWKYWLMNVLPRIFGCEFRLSLDSPEHINALVEFFNQSTRHVFISAGDCCNLSDPAVVKAAKLAMGRGVVVNVVKDDTAKTLSSVAYPIATVSRRLVQHFIVNDQGMTAVHYVGETAETVWLGYVRTANRFVKYFVSLSRTWDNSLP